jgi:hypothetical protein
LAPCLVPPQSPIQSYIQPHTFPPFLYLPWFSHKAYSSTLKMEAKGFSEMLVYLHQNTCPHTSEYGILYYLLQFTI